MKLYTVNFSYLNGVHVTLYLIAIDSTIITKVKEILQDNGGGSAEVIGDNFYKIIDA